MPKAPCNDFCQGDCRPGPGCAFNLLCLCCDECIEPPAALAAGADTPQAALLRLIIHDPGFFKVRRELAKAIRKHKGLPEPHHADGDHPSDKA